MIGKEMKVIPPGFRKLCKEWDLRVMVLLSLALQIILIVLGRRRRFDSRLWIRIVAWSAYLAADSVATFALGILSGNLTDLFDEHAKALGANTELEAFWAPFLLLHLGGPDTTTAYAFEDNELWLRHFLKLIVQTIIAFYVFLMAWTGGSRLSMLSIPMFLVGLIKYGERTWVLWSASYEKLRQSLFSSTRPHPYDDIEFFTKEYYLKITHGYITRPILVSEVQLRTEKLLRAYGFLRLRAFSWMLHSAPETETVANLFSEIFLSRMHSKLLKWSSEWYMICFTPRHPYCILSGGCPFACLLSLSPVVCWCSSLFFSEAKNKSTQKLIFA